MAVNYTTIKNASNLVSTISDSLGVAHGLDAVKLEGKEWADIVKLVEGRAEAYVVDTTVAANAAFKATTETITLTGAFTDGSGNHYDSTGTVKTSIPLTDLHVGDVVFVSGQAYPDRYVKTINKTGDTVTGVVLEEFYRTPTTAHTHSIGEATTGAFVTEITAGTASATFTGTKATLKLPEVTSAGAASDGHTHGVGTLACSGGAVTKGTTGISATITNDSVTVSKVNSGSIANATAGGSVKHGASAKTNSATAGITAVLADGTVTATATNGAVGDPTATTNTSIYENKNSAGAALSTAEQAKRVMVAAVYAAADQSLTFNFASLAQGAVTQPTITASVGTAITVTDAGHTHALNDTNDPLSFEGTAHTHTFTDPTYSGTLASKAVSVNDPGHNHEFTQPTISGSTAATKVYTGGDYTPAGTVAVTHTISYNTGSAVTAIPTATGNPV